MIGPTPLFDFFKRGEVARDVKLLAAAGALAPRALEQISILVLLLDDPDLEVRSTAQRTVVVLRFYEDLGLADIASLLGRSASTVRSDLRRALTRLKGLLV